MFDLCSAVGSPLAHFDDMFELGLARCDGERNRALNHVRTDRRQIESALGAARGERELIRIVQIGDDHFGAEFFESRASGVPGSHDGANRKTLGEQFADQTAFRRLRSRRSRGCGVWSM